MSQTDLHHVTATQSTIATGGYIVVPPPDFVLVPLTGAVVILAGILIAAVVSSRVRRSVASQALDIQANSAQLSDQIAQLSGALAIADARLAQLAGRLDEQSRSSQGAAPTSYNVAIRMARSGATRQELMSACGVTQQEADLVLRLHASDPSARSAA